MVVVFIVVVSSTIDVAGVDGSSSILVVSGSDSVGGSVEVGGRMLADDDIGMPPISVVSYMATARPTRAKRIVRSAILVVRRRCG